MRFYDDVLAEIDRAASSYHTGIKSLTRHLKSAVVIHGQNVMDYYSTEINGIESFNKQINLVVPPFPEIWLEFTRPARYIVEGKEIEWLAHGFQRAGVFVTSTKDRDDHGWHVTYICFFAYDPQAVQSAPGSIQYPYAIGTFDITQDGRLTGADLDLTFPDVHNEIMQLVLQWCHDIAADVTILALSFLNCRNVELVETKPTPRERTAEERRLNQWPQPETTYHTIHVKPFKATKRSIDASAPPGDTTQLDRIVRGHFHIYTADKPMLGKPWGVGQFWIPPRMKSGAAPDTDYSIDL